MPISAKKSMPKKKSMTPPAVLPPEVSLKRPLPPRVQKRAVKKAMPQYSQTRGAGSGEPTQRFQHDGLQIFGIHLPLVLQRLQEVVSLEDRGFGELEGRARGTREQGSPGLGLVKAGSNTLTASLCHSRLKSPRC